MIMFMIRKLLRMSTFLRLLALSRIHLVDFGTLIIDEVYVSYSTSNNVDEIVESNIPAEPSKSFEFSCVDYEFKVVSTDLSSSESSEFLIMI